MSGIYLICIQRKGGGWRWVGSVGGTGVTSEGKEGKEGREREENKRRKVGMKEGRKPSFVLL